MRTAEHEPELDHARDSRAPRWGWLAMLSLLSPGTGAMGCVASDPVVQLQPSKAINATDYKSVLGRWTRRDEVYDGLFSVIFVHATFYSPEFRKAFVNRFPEFYGRGSGEGRRLTLEDPDAESHWAFFLAASTPNQTWNDLSRDDSIWRVTLRSDGGPEVNAKVRPIKINANLKTFFPYLTPFAVGYGLDFPLVTLQGQPLITPQTRMIRLRISSALGAAEMAWHLEPEE